MMLDSSGGTVRGSSMTERRWWTLLSLLVLFTLGRVATTHRVFSQTSDEPWHLVSGYDLLSKRVYTTDLHHPPLARIFFAIPFLDTPDPPGADGLERGNLLLLRNERYTQNLGRARLGNLLFLALGLVVVALWGRRIISPAGGLVAALLFASLPPILAHGGLATTDLSIAATLPLALYALTLVLDEPRWNRALFLGVAIAAGLLSKYSFLLFFPLCALILIILRRRFPIGKILVATAITIALVWGAYGFTWSTIEAAHGKASEYATEAFGSPWMARAFPIPAPLFAAGMLEVKHHDIHGHKAFLFEQQRVKGWWYYFPVALFFKTPIPFMILVLTGCAMMARRAPEIVLFSAAILAVAMTSSLNIGVRHLLPIYAPLAIAAAYAVVEARRWKVAAIALVGWLIISGVVAHPDYLPWFNAFAGRHPERILVDSNLDWGQDVLRLVRTSRSMGIRQMTVSLFTTADIERVGLPPHTILQALSEVHGWLAISEMNIALGRGHSPEVKKWLDEDVIGKRPYRRIGKSIRLYFIP